MRLRVRRLDQHNYVIEEVKTAKDTGREYTKIKGYYGTLDSLLLHGIGELPEGDSVEALRQDLEACKKELIRALFEAIHTGQIREQDLMMSDGAREGLKRYRERQKKEAS